MKLSQFEFELPEELLAIYPAEHRDESRLMVLNKAAGTIEHKQFKDVINYFEEGDVMMLNNKKCFLQECLGIKRKRVLE
jgi:S-adenosylmethionine:tRNA ribosyltransferase-isomerase